MRYLFELGREPELSLVEIFSLLSTLGFSFTSIFYTKNFFILDSPTTLPTLVLINRLGGTKKIAASVQVEPITPQSLAEYLERTQKTGKINFSLQGGEARQWSLAIKKELKLRKRSVRYIEPKNTATILHNHLVAKQADLTLTTNSVFVTEAIQTIVKLSERDYGRPKRDMRAGMLPPKLGRILINLSETNTTDVLYDPFCGSGTILSEAVSMGYEHLIGSDIDLAAIERSRENVDWVKKKFIDKNHWFKNGNLEFFKCDVRALPVEKLRQKNISVIVTEPYLGKPLYGNESEKWLINQATELAKLYVEAFEQFAKILSPNGRVVFISPRFFVASRSISVSCVEAIKSLGFRIMPFLNGKKSLLYCRQGQQVGREIWRFYREKSFVFSRHMVDSSPETSKTS